MGFQDQQKGVRTVAGGDKPKHRKIAWGFGIAWTAVIALVPLSDRALAQVNNLEEALVRAYTSNPTLLSQRAQLRALDESVNQAISGWRPTVTASASYQMSDTDGESDVLQGGSFVTNDTEVDQDTLQAGVTVNQNVFTGLRTLNETREAKANVRAGREQLRAIEQSILLQAVTAYMDVLRDEAVVGLSKNNVAVLERQLEASQDRFRVGEITRTDVAQSEARLSGSQSNLISSEAQLVASQASFKQIIGVNPGALEQPPALPALPGSLQEAEAVSLDRNPELSAAREAEQASRYAINVARGALLPTLTFQGQYSYSDTSGEAVNGVFVTGDSNNTALTLTANLSVPLYQGGAAYSRLRQAKQANSSDRLLIAEAERETVQVIANAWEALRSARATIDASRQQVRANEIAFEGVQQEAQVGSRTTLDVLDAEQELLDSRVTLVQAQRDEYVAAFQLLSAVGQLNAERLNLAANRYDPEDHYNAVDNKWIGIGQRDDFR